jgi:hypothetical protein
MDLIRVKHIYPSRGRENSKVKGESLIFFLLNSEHNKTRNISCRVVFCPAQQSLPTGMLITGVELNRSAVVKYRA